MTHTNLNYVNRVKIFLAPEKVKPEPIQFYLSFGKKEPCPGEVGNDAGEILSSPLENGNSKVIVSVGDKDKINSQVFRIAGASITKWLSKFDETSSTVHLKGLDELSANENLSAFIEGLYLGSFSFSRYKTSGTKYNDIRIYLDIDGDHQNVNPIIDHARIITDAVNLNRDWAHEPANVINPATLAQRAQDVARSSGLKCTILDEDALSKMNAGGILSVGQGSKTPSRMIILEYPGTQPSAYEKPVVLVGKAITFDTGGYSLKDTTNIQQMKFDKSGGLVVIAILQAVAALKLKRPVIGVIAAAENMISDKSYRPDDILTTLSGKTIEISTTDAEGRLVLADALTYVQNNYQPEAIIDLATLTGGVIIALGRVRAGLLSNNDELAGDLYSSGDATGERLWRLPLDEDYEKQIEGDDADLKNSGGREASTIIGGTFLRQFVANQIPWAHIDIAGVADLPKPSPLGPKGATGFGVRLLLHYLENSR